MNTSEARKARLAEIQLGVERHRAVVHPLVKRLSHNPNDLTAWQRFAAQHHHIVREFPYHIYSFFQRLPPVLHERLFAVLSDEFPPGTSDFSGFSAHAQLQLELCHSLGVEPDVEPLPRVADFIAAHRTCAREARIDFVLGVFGPGHEYAVPLLFRQLVSGAPPLVNPRYLFEHLTIDVDHARRFAEVLVDRDLAEVAAGAEWSLDRRAEAWDDILAAIESEEGQDVGRRIGRVDRPVFASPGRVSRWGEAQSRGAE